jgi:hypothetical protein
MSEFFYRGVSYTRDRRDPRPSDALEHVYRGHHYSAALQHSATSPDPTRPFQYRGHDYRHPSAGQAS